MTKPRVILSAVAVLSAVGLLASRTSYVSPHRDVLVLERDAARVVRPAYAPPKPATELPGLLAEGGSSDADPTNGETITFHTWPGYHGGEMRTLRVADVMSVVPYRTAAKQEGCEIQIVPYGNTWFCDEAFIDVVNRLLAARWKVAT